MIKKQIKHDLVVYENFLTEDECKRIKEWIDYTVDNGRIKWNPISFYESYALGFFDYDPTLVKFGFPADYMQKVLKEKFKSATEDAMGIEVREVSFHSQRWLPGAFASFHSDNSDPETGEPNAFARSKIASFLYLNDDFDGGLLNFADGVTTIKPQTGLLAVFKGGHDNKHEVTVVKDGNRYTIGSFWDYAECEYSQETLDKWAEELKPVREGQSKQAEEWKRLKEKGIVVSPYRGAE
ncbi:MAG: prolyl 3-hydroxylase 3 [Bacteroidota bacterium]|jgi:hypothetical protein